MSEENLPAVPAEISPAKLEIDTAGVNIVAAPSLGSVLPADFYDGAGELALTKDQQDLLAEYVDVPEDEIDIRPDGLAYIGHFWHRRALGRVFGVGQWAMVPGSGVVIEPGSNKIYQRWVLKIGGRYAAEAVGSAEWFPNSNRANKADAVEGAKSDALTKCCKDLGIANNLWDRRYLRRWRQVTCVKVKVRTSKGIEDWWRRSDDPPFDGEIQQPSSAARLAAEAARAPSASEAPAPEHSASAEAKKKEAGAPAALPGHDAPAPPSESQAAGASTEAATFDVSAGSSSAPPAYVTDGKLRLFFARARRAKLLADPAEGLVRIGNLLERRLPTNTAGRTHNEILVDMVRSCNQAEFEKLIRSLGDGGAS